MQIDKDTIVSFLREQGDQQKADRARQELPETVDHEQDSGLLQQLGVDPSALISRFGGGKGIPGL